MTDRHAPDPAPAAADAARVAAERAARSSYGRLVAILAAPTRDLALAEDALADAFERALRTWPEQGVPDNPEAWLVTVARNRQRDLLTSSARRVVELSDQVVAPFSDVAPLAELDPDAIPDRRLELMFACAHPAIAGEARTPLILQVVLGFDAAEIGAAFAVPAATMSQRLVRAKRRIKRAGVPFAVPVRADMTERLDAVLEAIYGAYAIDWLSAGTMDEVRTSIADEARWLAVLLATLLGTEPEAWGLAALLTLAQSRAPARVPTKPGERWPALDDQDPSLWSRSLIADGEAMLRRASSLGRPLGRFQLEAAIQSVHCDRARTGIVDYPALLKLHRGLVAIAPTDAARAALARVEESTEAHRG